jgi:His/Glu/Gln/Arg/opine family amino acid ABC transporter permease subunit
VRQLLPYLPALGNALGISLLIAILSILGAALTSVALGTLRASRKSPASRVSAGAVEILRGASAIIYLFWIYYALPLIPGAPRLSPFAASVLVLSLTGGAYGAEIVRGGIQAVPRSQLDACHALGLSRWHTVLRVMFPQALSQVVPAFGSLAVDMMKWTVIVSFVGVQDVFYLANTARAVTNQTVAIYLLLVVIYWVLCSGTSLIFRGIEYALPLSKARRAARATGRSFFPASVTQEPVVES